MTIGGCPGRPPARRPRWLRRTGRRSDSRGTTRSERVRTSDAIGGAPADAGTQSPVRTRTTADQIAPSESGCTRRSERSRLREPASRGRRRRGSPAEPSPTAALRSRGARPRGQCPAAKVVRRRRRRSIAAHMTAPVRPRDGGARIRAEQPPETASDRRRSRRRPWRRPASSSFEHENLSLPRYTRRRAWVTWRSRTYRQHSPAALHRESDDQHGYAKRARRDPTRISRRSYGATRRPRMRELRTAAAALTAGTTRRTAGRDVSSTTTARRSATRGRRNTFAKSARATVRDQSV